MKNNLPPTNDYESQARRPLTYAERKVNLSSIKEKMKTLSSKLDTALSQVKYDIIHNEWGTPYDLIDKISEIVTAIQKEWFDFWKQTASAEMKVKVKPTNKRIEGIMLAQNRQTIEEMLSQISDRFKKAWYKQFTDRSEEFSEWWILSRFFNGLKSLFVMGSINLWRETVFEEHPDKVYALQFSAILDDRTTDICRSLDGIIVKMNSKEYYLIRPPRHRWCRSLLIEILTDEPYKPRLTKNIPIDNGTPPAIEDIKKHEENKKKIINVSK